MQNIECEQCGGTDFYKEAGYYYCSGCQIQSQEVQEYVFDEFDGDRGKSRSKKVQSEKSEKTDNKITSWECYNYVLLGLTNELINLGADKKLKQTVKILWLMYLEKLQVFKRGKDELPKLQAVCSDVDAQIVYGKQNKKKRKRNKSSSDETNITSLDSSSVKRERAKRKRALAHAQYEEFSQKSQGTASLHNETLTSLQSGSEKSSRCTTPIAYNIYASRELRRKQSKYHLRKHRFDLDRELPCHKITYRKVSHKYRASPYILSLNKLYAILYLGLLIIKDKIQLSDMLRFIREGHLSFNCYSHLLPEEFSDKILNFRNFKKNTPFTNAGLRTISSDMAKLLRIDWYISRPDLTELSERYCKELNLPNEICDCVKNIISRTGIRMSFRKRESKVPNYEGRVLSIILFVIKLLFGLDGETEFCLANYADILNQSDAVNPKMFNVVKWLKHIEYRNLVMVNSHFPTNFQKNQTKNVDLLVGFLAKKEYPENKHNKKKDPYKQMLDKLKDSLLEPETTDFPVTLTPFLDYTKVLSKVKYLNILSEDYTNDSLINILRPNKFLKIVNKDMDPEVINGGANENWKVEKLICAEQERKKELNERRKFVTVKLSLQHETNNEIEHERSEVDVDIFKENFQITNEREFRRNSKRLNRYSYVDKLDLDKIQRDVSMLDVVYPKHYNPYERFWIRSQIRIDAVNQKDCQKFLSKFPYTFRLLFKECQRIAEQSEQDLLVEYQFTELYLTYVADYKMKNRKKEIKSKLIKKYLDRSVNFW